MRGEIDCHKNKPLLSNNNSTKAIFQMEYRRLGRRFNDKFINSSHRFGSATWPGNATISVGTGSTSGGAKKHGGLHVHLLSGSLFYPLLQSPGIGDNDMTPYLNRRSVAGHGVVGLISTGRDQTDCKPHGEQRFTQFCQCSCRLEGKSMR